MVNETKRIHCEYYREGIIGCYCSAPGGCIYNDGYQLLVGDIKGCKVNGHVNPDSIPWNKKSALKPGQLEETISTISISISPQSRL